MTTRSCARCLVLLLVESAGLAMLIVKQSCVAKTSCSFKWIGEVICYTNLSFCQNCWQFLVSFITTFVLKFACTKFHDFHFWKKWWKLVLVKKGGAKIKPTKFNRKQYIDLKCLIVGSCSFFILENSLSVLMVLLSTRSLNLDLGN